MLGAPSTSGDFGRVALPMLAALAGVAATLVAWRTTASVTTYAAASTPAAGADLAAAVGLLAAGAGTLIVRPGSSTGTLTALIGATWLAHDWVGWEGAPAVARSVAMVAVPLIVPVLVHLSLAQPTGWFGGHWGRGFVLVAYCTAGLVALATALVRDPFLDQHCWSNCHDNTFLVRADPDRACALGAIGLYSTIVIATIAAVACVVRLLVATRVARRVMSYILIPTTAALLSTVVYAVVLIADPDEDPQTTPFTTVFFLRAATLILLSVGVGVVALRDWRTGRAVALLADALGAAPAPGSLGPALARSLGDDDLEVAYWLPTSKRYVDATGRTVDPAPGPGQTSTAIVRDGQPVALVIHDGALTPEREIGAATRLAVDNERLRAEVLAQLDDLRASRTRIVEAADVTRRRLERNVHDVAQQRLLAASFELRLAHGAAVASGDAALVERLSVAAEGTQRALVELRELAHGIFPAILTEAGLEPALRTLAARSPVAVDIIEVSEARFRVAAETAAYFVVVAGLELASHRSATVATVTVRPDRDQLVVEIDDDGAGAAADTTHVADRVGALGGTLAVAPGSLRAEIPCAS